MDAAALMPETVIAVEVTLEFSAALVTAVKLKVFGTVSATTVVAEKVAVTPPIVRTAWVVESGIPEAVTLTVTV